MIQWRNGQKSPLYFLTHANMTPRSNLLVKLPKGINDLNVANSIDIPYSSCLSDLICFLGTFSDLGSMTPFLERFLTLVLWHHTVLLFQDIFSSICFAESLSLSQSLTDRIHRVWSHISFSSSCTHFHKVISKTYDFNTLVYVTIISNSYI